ncbi:hypothetical protein AMTR_s00041p00219080 [Amborella trichopoda]|uniref:TAZ-type domain-containing protein n=1 Tax=Amborella trichopoda TaxID=13333 RepID=W1PTZ7_AMBTC|nr:hypothetical protein AMTR_s00041p00219080 [Amborella trichopoda]
MKQRCRDKVHRKTVPILGGPSNSRLSSSMQSTLSIASSAQTQTLENVINEDWIHIEWLVILHHGSKCSALENQCAYHVCVNAQRLWMHISSCERVHCLVTLCPLPAAEEIPSNSGKVDLIRSREEAMSSELLGDVQHPLKRMTVEQSGSAIPIFTNEDLTKEVQYPISEVCDLGKAKTGVQIKEPSFVDVGSSLPLCHESQGNKLENGMEHTSQVKGDISFTSSDGLLSQATNEDCTEINECRMEINQESVILLADHEAGTMHGM